MATWERQKAEDLTQRLRRGPGWEGVIDGYAPVQGEGTVDGHPWYFRARHQAWSFEVAEPPTIDWGRATVGAEVAGWYAEGTWGEDEFAASYMPYRVAWAIIERGIARFRDGRLWYMRGGRTVPSLPTTPGPS